MGYDGIVRIGSRNVWTCSHNHATKAEAYSHAISAAKMYDDPRRKVFVKSHPKSKWGNKE